MRSRRDLFHRRYVPFSAGDLDRRVQFLRSELIDDGYQTRPGPYEPHGGPVWAARQSVRDAERYAASTVGVDTTDRFTVRWSSFTAQIKHSDRLACEGRTYGIVGIKELGRRAGVEITASEIRE